MTAPKTSWVDRWLPAAASPGAGARARRESLVRVSALALAAVALVFAIRFGLADGWGTTRAQVYLANVGALLVAAWAVPRAGAKPTGFVVGLIVLAVLGWSQYTQGGFRMSVLPWLAACPLVFTMLAGPRLGAALTSGALALQGGLYALGRAGYTFVDLNQDTAAESRAIALLSTLAAMALVTAMGSLYEVSRRRAQALAARTLSDLERANRDLREARDWADEANRAKTQFVANISHELRTPMNGVIGMADLLRTSELSDEQQEYTETIHRSARSLLSIIDDILDFSKLDFDKLELTTQRYELETLVNEVLSLLAAEAYGKGVELSATFGRDVPSDVISDPGRLRQVLLNLVSNAIKFTTRGEVNLACSLVKLEEPKALLRFEVRDTGIGIPKHLLPKVFDSFYQTDNSTTRRYGGTGLGLTISKRLVELMGGQLAVDSVPDRGSTFYFTLPVTVPEDVLDSSDDRSGPFTGLRALCLVSGSRPRAQAALASALEREGVLTDVAGSLKEARAALEQAAARELPYRVCVVDTSGDDALELAVQLRALELPVRPAILLLVPPGRRDLRAEATALGLPPPVSKPARRGTLMADAMRAMFPGGSVTGAPNAAEDGLPRGPRRGRGARPGADRRAPLRRGAHGLPDAWGGRLRGHGPDPRPRGRRAPHHDHRPHRPRQLRRPAPLPRRGDERLPRQAGPVRRAAGHAGQVGPRHRLRPDAEPARPPRGLQPRRGGPPIDDQLARDGGRGSAHGQRPDPSLPRRGAPDPRGAGRAARRRRPGRGGGGGAQAGLVERQRGRQRAVGAVHPPRVPGPGPRPVARARAGAPHRGGLPARAGRVARAGGRAEPRGPGVSAPPRVCVIGAGSSGLPVAKALKDRGLPFVCYDKSDRVGGNWVFRNKNGMSAAYRSLHINTSRDRMEYRDLPMPADYPDFPHHSLVAEYFEAYVERFELRPHLRFETGVARAQRRPGGGWDVTLDDGATERFDALAVANGHHWDPQWPDPPFPGTFCGAQLHAHAYVDPTEPHDLVDKRVVVLGMGNSAMDIACELSQRGVAERVFLAARRGAHVIPHYLFGRPLDQIISAVPPWVPLPVRQGAGALIHRVAVGKMSRYGLPEPEHGVAQAHPTISSEILARLGRGDITPKPNLRALDGDHVVFEDGTRERVDAIIYCTGYKVSFPFFEPGFLSAPDNDLPLFFRVFEPRLPDLFFIGLLQPLGAVMPLAEAQAKWVAEYLSGEYALPSEAEMRAQIEAYHRALARRYVPSRRHTMQVDFDDYLYALGKERRRGRARAGHAGPLGRLRAQASSWASRTRY